MERITDKMLDDVAERINRITNSPSTSYSMGTQHRNFGKRIANIGNYHISRQYNGVSLFRMESEGGATSDVLSCGYTTKRGLYEVMQAYIRGYKDGKGE